MINSTSVICLIVRAYRAVFLLIFLLPFLSFSQVDIKMYQIPTQFLNLYNEIGFNTINKDVAVKGFEISEQITFKEYKRYLETVKEDSSQSFYYTQLPDSSIGSYEVWSTYISDPIYEHYPVLGISWENAMNYCNWRTLQENGDSIQFVYRLPLLPEWLAANYYLNKENNIPNDFNKNYADWTLNTKDESLYYHTLAESPSLNIFLYAYNSEPGDPPALRRKMVVGNSYLYQMPHPLFHNFSFYEFKGYRQVAFRIVKDYEKIGEKRTH